MQQWQYNDSNINFPYATKILDLAPNLRAIFGIFANLLGGCILSNICQYSAKCGQYIAFPVVGPKLFGERETFVKKLLWLAALVGWLVSFSLLRSPFAKLTIPTSSTQPRKWWIMCQNGLESLAHSQSWYVFWIYVAYTIPASYITCLFVYFTFKPS